MDKSKVRYVIIKETDIGGVLRGIGKEEFEQLDLGFSYEEFESQVD